MSKKVILPVCLIIVGFNSLQAKVAPKHEDTEFYSPIATVVTPG